MNHVLTWCDIPVADMQRAKQFYQAALGYEFIDQNTDDHAMAIIKAADDSVSGMLVKGEYYEPSATGAVVYLNGGSNLSEALIKVESVGGKVVFPKTPVEEGSDKGYFAQFVDSEGNRVGLYSLN